ncbi:MAG TPA: lysophospholipid acyltransferase family protein [Candidatus Dormibacteraeota bacterium]|nr:lysophospholipid acyltransferase family protein [Candidatus Dormibacteraeota bacterium]
METTYQGPDYRAAVSGGWGPPDPLLHPDPIHPPRLYLWVVAVLHWLLPKLFRLRVEGLENLPAGGPYIIASNHQAWFDPLFLLAVLPSPVPMVYSMARRDTVFNRGWKRALVPPFGVFAIAPHGGELDLTGLASVYHVLSRGGRVLIFPEGRYSRGSRLRPLKQGVAHFALQAGVPIVPVAIDGVDRLRLGSRVTITIGRPIQPDPPAWWIPSRRVLKLIESVRRAILTSFGHPPKPPEQRLLARLAARLRGFARRTPTPPDGEGPSEPGAVPPA